MVTNTGIGVGIGIPFRNNAHGGDKPYLPPEIKDSLKAIVIAYGKSNDDADRSIVKNLVDASNPFIISNAAFKLNSGFGEYEQDFTDWKKSPKVTSFDSESIKFTSDVSWVLLYHPSSIGEDIPSFKVRVKLYGKGTLYYSYITQEGKHTNVAVKSEIFETPICYNTKYTGEKGVNVGFTLGVTSGECSGTITQIPSFEGAFVTDGIDDLITSTKTVQEMLGGSNEITVVSMAHFIKGESNAPEICRINQIRRDTRSIRNSISKIGKSGIFGYTYKNGVTTINNILGDKNDCTTEGNLDGIVAPFSVEGYYYNNNSNPLELCSIAWYWTIIANKVLTTDEINQVIAYYNLDRTLKPDILCNTIKQGITNENHAEFGDKLIDFSGNGRDIQLNNLAWDGDSGIGKYNYPNWKVNVTQGNKYARIVYYDSINGTYSANLKGITDLYKSYGLSIEIRVNRANTVDFHSIKEDSIYTMTPPDDTTSIDIRFGGENVYNASCDITITQIPSHAGALCLDGVNDFGKVTGMPIYKDYTVIADYIRISAKENVQDAPILSKSKEGDDGAFIFNYVDYSTSKTLAYSFANINNVSYINDFERNIYYQSKYTNNGNSINAGTGVDTNSMWLGTYRDNVQNYFTGAIYSLMTFPYSMSEFLIERQLKKHKLGTLYPDMVEFRPVIKANANYKITYYQIDSTNTWKSIKVGDYIVIGAKLAFQITFDNDASELKEVVSPQLSGIIVEKKPSNPGYNIYSYITSKSPQKINITIDEYIRFEDIVQPYPVLLRFKDENGNEVSWGGKFKVGSTITRIGSAADSNLLPNIYNIFGLLLNDNQVTSSKAIVEKTMVFKAKKTYIFDNNEPKCILSPRLLRIPNSSYKILGYIPDISGHGNHGKINNSAYAGMSGVNGYSYDYNNSSFWGDSNIAKVVSGELVEYFAVKNSTGFSNITSGVYKGEIKVTGVTKAISENKISRLRIYTNSTTDNELIDITQDGNYNIDIKGVGDANRVFFYAIPNNPNESIVVRLTEPIYIEQVGEYEGAYCLDGVDDSITIPTLSSGGKQVLMKVNWNSLNHVLYDQRNNAEAPFCIVTASGSIAYNQRNVGGNTYIDGILNNHILVADLQAITHNIVLNNDYNVANSNSFIGTNYTKSIYAKMSLYDFMLFDEISTDDKILELNEYVGIEGNTE